MRQSGKKTFIVTVSGKRPLSEVKRDLTASGLEVDQVLEAVGSITGRAEADAVKKLRAIKGVADICEDSPVSVGPPDAPVS